MKQTKLNKLSLGKKTVSKLHELELRRINGGSSYPSYACVSDLCDNSVRRLTDTRVNYC
jgi:hypothetical protein